ncbi:sodium ion-motive force-driven serine/threonine transporter [Campylobacter blaseri]|uniref:Serine/threonine transporter SstT n=1 Tax=Campylobacter blaseri TaxID=2042961 RepID=A0A2P8R1X8_9BACT|nr:serine/threonine transporter SstT [Campylobacter blaseri]PSM52502.1 serine/threonine transporter SstT [Campylobacter blaseri]PSM54150.1 serine/threonine transporter SstT [Campylobacter blaseri]QKF85798.1 sodium ion-motive force-driven serine/threonine transporter [Campylobacter blaseri]
MSKFSTLVQNYTDKNLVLRIVIGVIVGATVGFLAQKGYMLSLVGLFGTLGKLFVGALKAAAPILVFILIASSILTNNFNNAKGIRKVIMLYLIGTFLAAVVGVIASFMFPTILVLDVSNEVTRAAPKTVVEVLENLLFNIVDNPISALANANYIGILAWGTGFGIALRFCTNETKNLFVDLADAITMIVRFIIQLAPFGIMGLVATSVYSTGGQALMGYGRLLLVLVGAMVFLALIVNPIIAFIFLKKNPYPLVFTCLKESGLTAFFTRSSAANIPVNLNLCRKLKLDEELYPISIPLGATINMGGAAVVISILTLAAAHTLGITPTFGTALLLSLVAAVSACGASGVAGGSLMLIPLASSLFNISNDIAMQVVAIGFIIGVIQDSVETGINSSTDVLFTAIASESREIDSL